MTEIDEVLERMQAAIEKAGRSIGITPNFADEGPPEKLEATLDEFADFTTRYLGALRDAVVELAEIIDDRQ